MKKIDRRTVVAGLSSLSAGLAASALMPPRSMAQAKSIKLGALMPLSGRMASYGVSAQPGAELAAKLINDAGGIKSLGGAKLELQFADTKGDAKVTVSEAERFLGDGVTGIIGPFSSLDALAANPLSDQYKIPFVSPFWTSEKAFDLNSRYSRTLNLTSVSYAEGCLRMLDHLQKNHGLAGKKIGLAFDNSEYGRGVANGIKRRLEAKGVQLVIELPVTPPVTDFGPTMLRLRDAGIDVLLSGFYFQECVLIFRAMDALNYRVPIVAFATGFTDPRLPGALGPEVAARVLQNPVFGATAGMREDTKYAPLLNFLKANEKEAIRPGVTPSVDFDFYSLGAQAVFVFRVALEKAASLDGEKLNDAIAKMDLPAGNSDLILPFYQPSLGWEPNGAPKNQVVSFQQWQDSKAVIVYPPELATTKLKL